MSPSTLETPPPGAVVPESYEDVGRVIAVLGGSSRKGSWEPPARLRVPALMGGVELDFREANLLEGETVVDVLAVMGGVTITLAVMKRASSETSQAFTRATSSGSAM